jgi:hypothetical protein
VIDISGRTADIICHLFRIYSIFLPLPILFAPRPEGLKLHDFSILALDNRIAALWVLDCT